MRNPDPRKAREALGDGTERSLATTATIGIAGAIVLGVALVLGWSLLANRAVTHSAIAASPTPPTASVRETSPTAVAAEASAKPNPSALVVPAPATAGAAATGLRQSPRQPPVVVIDAGHQGRQDTRQEPIGPGASATKNRVESGTSGVVTGIDESEINLQVALRLETSLVARGVKVIMVRRSQNVDISNAERAAIANKAHAALFIRLHCDGVDDKSTHGLLMLEPGVNRWTGPIVARSKIAALDVYDATLAATGAAPRGIQPRTDLSGFNWAEVPTILVEMGVMSNPAEDRRLSTVRYQQELADGMTKGVERYLGVQ